MKPKTNSSTGPRQKLTRWMRKKKKTPVVIIMLAMFMSYAAGAGEPPVLEIPWFTMDGGGGTSTGDEFIVSGTIGQPDAGKMSGGGFEISGGFWSSPAVPEVQGDCDDDVDVDLDDYACFFACLLGPAQGLPAECGPFDFNNDGDVDLQDFGGFQTSFGD